MIVEQREFGGEDRLSAGVTQSDVDDGLDGRARRAVRADAQGLRPQRIQALCARLIASLPIIVLREHRASGVAEPQLDQHQLFMLKMPFEIQWHQGRDLIRRCGHCVGANREYAIIER